MRLGNLLAPLVYALPENVALPILSGPLRGKRWIVSSQTANFWYGTYEKDKIQKFLAYLKPDSVVYDAGANAGYYALLSAFHAVQVFAFEPVPAIATILERHVALNRVSNCTVIRKALGAAPGEAFFEVASTGKNTGIGRLSERGQLRVEITSLDDFCGDHPPPSIIKMDIEGAETLALQGARQMLATHRPVLFLATHNNSAPECSALLASLGYRLETFAEDEILALP